MERTFSASGHTISMAACSLAIYTMGMMMEKGPFTSADEYTVRSAVSNAA